MNLIKPILSLTGQIKAKKFIHATKYPVTAQKKILKEILQKNKDTIFGKKHSFKQIRCPKEYSDRIPVGNYDSMKDMIDLVFKGIKNDFYI